MRKVLHILTVATLTWIIGPARAAPSKSPIGLRADGSVIHAWVTEESFRVKDPKPHLLVVGDSSIAAPGWIVTRVEAPTAGLSFPPSGNAYQGPNREAHYLWRWSRILSPDAVAGNDALSDALVSSGEIPRWSPGLATPSLARAELIRRLDRSPRQVAQQLARHYGHQFEQVTYIPALAVLGRLRFAEQTGNEAMARDARRLALAAAPPDAMGGPAVAGHLVFAELAAKEPAARDRVILAAAAGLDAEGRPLPFVPNHDEMSDSVFMNCPLLAAAGALTGEQRYFEASLNHVRFMRAMCVRSDGLYRHSPRDEAAWGRGNGFPALGLALTLSYWPEAVPGREEILTNLREHLAALAPHQHASGMWHQVIDRPESYREFSATCMIAFAMVRGVREGWLDRAEYEPRYLRAWEAIKLRIDLEGKELVDVCTGTGKQGSLEDYLLRTAILGRDERGGAMALLLATELGR